MYYMSFALIKFLKPNLYIFKVTLKYISLGENT